MPEPDTRYLILDTHTMASSNFIDYVKINCRSGAGGPGSAHFMRAKHVPNGGPDGGDGGRGGHIILRGNSQLWTLLHLKYRKHVHADDGERGGEALCTGKSGEDMILEVPIGTVARDAETGEVLTEITTEGEEVILLKAGRGGLGNDHFKSPINQAPHYAQPGEAGIADYPFTTLVPNLGVVAYRDFKSFVMADIPGIIEGAAEGKGLGTRFLRHIERNSILLFLIPADSNDIKADYKVLLNELKKYNPELLDKERMLAISKSDLLDDELMTLLQKELPKGLPVVFISSHNKKGLQELKDLIWATLNKPS
jgi:GTP-binding protein